MKGPVLFRIRLHASNCYLIAGDGAILVDAGLSGEGTLILKRLIAKGIRPVDLQLILLTHGHADHAGAATEVAKATGAPIALRYEDARWITSGQEVPAPPVTTWAKAISKLLSARFLKTAMSTPRFTPDIILSSGTQSLDKYGVPATILHTPGHTAGSISVVFEDGRAIVGDLAMNGLPSSPFKPTPPIVAQDPSLLPKSWTGIREFGAKTIFPGHGKSFDWLSLAQDYGIME